MPFDVQYLAESRLNGSVVADRRLYMTADESAAVEEGDPAARFLLAGAGHTIPADRAAALGLTVVNGRVQLPVFEATETPAGAATTTETKQEEPRPNKSSRPAENKGGGK